MKKIPLSGKHGKGKYCLIDDSDVDIIGGRPCHAQPVGDRLYVKLTHNGKTTSLHRLVLGLRDGEMGDHINGNTLDNRRRNLRCVDTTTNNLNRHKKKVNCTSRYIGVSWDKKLSKWRAMSRIYGKNYHFGLFPTEKRARRAYLSGVKGVLAAALLAAKEGV